MQSSNLQSTIFQFAICNLLICNFSTLNVIREYRNSFSGLSREVWYLALVTLINRAGTMVIPFLALYLNKDKGFTLSEVGTVMSAFGLGSVVGAWLGGKLINKIGFYAVMFWSLLLSGVWFIVLQFLDSFYVICAGIFVLMILADSFRPASFVAIKVYSEPENRTRSFSLMRLAINLGFSAGPAFGGLIITTMGYSGLFWVDGLTCLGAAILFRSLLSKKQAQAQLDEQAVEKKQSPYRDYPYLLLILIVFLIGFTFLQFFSTIPLYYRDACNLSESQIGLLLAMNGLLIFLIEMPLIKELEKPKYSIHGVLMVSMLVLSFSFLVLNLFSGGLVLVVSMLFLTFGEMLNFPFTNSLAMKRAERGRIGDYMALFSMAFSLAHILGHKTGMFLVDNFGFRITWYIMSGILFLSLFLFLWLKKLDE